MSRLFKRASKMQFLCELLAGPKSNKSNFAFRTTLTNELLGKIDVALDDLAAEGRLNLRVAQLDPAALVLCGGGLETRASEGFRSSAQHGDALGRVPDRPGGASRGCT